MNYFSRLTALVIASATSSALAAPDDQAKNAPDLLRFVNHDTLHGSFHSFGAEDTLVWKSPEAKAPIRFSISKLHRVVLNRGKAHQGLHQTSNIKLKNGDVIPGKIISVNSEIISLETQHLGKLEIPRTSLSRIGPSPFGGKLLYYGPLAKEGWKTMPTYSIKDENKDNQDANIKNDDPEDALTDWQHVGAAWYTGRDKSRFLVRENALPEKCRLSFKLAWRNSLYAKIALHADFSPPKYEHKRSSQFDMGATVGNAYMLTLSNHTATLYACTFDEDGKPLITRLQSSHSSLSLSGDESADFDLRLDRAKNNILLFVNGQFKAKWDLGAEYAGKGSHLAFKNQNSAKSSIRVSDIVISHWNGMKDSANSMESTNRDILLLNNGLDRFSGKFKELREGKVYFKGSYDNELVIPVDDVKEIRLATGKEDVPAHDKFQPQGVYFYIYPHGRITGVPSQGPDGKTKLQTVLLGEVLLDTRYINIIDFSQKNSLLDNWDDNF